MSKADIEVVKEQIKQKWIGDKYVPLRGWVRLNPVREGGLTAQLIQEAAEVADAHYTKLLSEQESRMNEEAFEAARESYKQKAERLASDIANGYSPEQAVRIVLEDDNGG